GSITNTGTVSATTSDPNQANNTSSVTTMVQTGQQSADLSITKTGPATVTTGQTFTYTLAVSNAGPNNATGVTVTDHLPSGVGYLPTTTNQCTNYAGTVTCTVGGLASGASATLTVVVSAPSVAGSITNTATVSGQQTDPNQANNSSSVTTTVQSGQQ